MKLISIHPLRTRKDRTEWLHHHFKDIFKRGVVLDVGCADAPLRNIIGKDKTATAKMVNIISKHLFITAPLATNFFLVPTVI